MANKDSEINSILLVIAMEQEALPLVRSLNLEMLSPLPFPFGLPAVAWKGKVGRSTVHLIWCGRYVLQYLVFYIFEYRQSLNQHCINSNFYNHLRLFTGMKDLE